MATVIACTAATHCHRPGRVISRANSVAHETSSRRNQVYPLRGGDAAHLLVEFALLLAGVITAAR